MKKLILLSSLIIVALSLSSCKTTEQLQEEQRVLEQNDQRFAEPVSIEDIDKLTKLQEALDGLGKITAQIKRGGFNNGQPKFQSHGTMGVFNDLNADKKYYRSTYASMSTLTVGTKPDCFQKFIANSKDPMNNTLAHVCALYLVNVSQAPRVITAINQNAKQ